MKAHVRGNAEAASELMPLVYDELRRLAKALMRNERPDHTLETTALVHEAYLRLIGGGDVDWRGKTHFFAVAAGQMRRVLIDHARKRRADKRGGGVEQLSLRDALAITSSGLIDALALNEAMTRLAEESPRQAKVVELRFYGGLSVEETAHVLEVSAGTVKGDWRVAKAWIARELSGSS